MLIKYFFFYPDIQYFHISCILHSSILYILFFLPPVASLAALATTDATYSAVSSVALRATTWSTARDISTTSSRSLSFLFLTHSAIRTSSCAPLPPTACLWPSAPSSLAPCSPHVDELRLHTTSPFLRRSFFYCWPDLIYRSCAPPALFGTSHFSAWPPPVFFSLISL